MCVRDARRNLKGLVQVARLDQEEAAHLLAGLDDWGIGRCQRAVVNAHRIAVTGGNHLAAGRDDPDIPSRVEIAMPRPI